MFECSLYTSQELGSGNAYSIEQQRYASALRRLESGAGDPDIEQILTQVIYNYGLSKCSEGRPWGPQSGGATPSGFNVKEAFPREGRFELRCEC